MTGKPSDIEMFNGLNLHGAMPNKSSNKIRSAVLLQNLPKFVKPHVKSKKDYPYPKVLNEDEEINAEG